MTTKALLLSAYHTDSHKRWSEELINHLDDIDWTLLSLPGRHFPWRIRGNPISWMITEDETLSEAYDVVVATSMVDLSTLIGLYPHLGQAHKVVYFHENQFAYPLADGQPRRAEPLMVGLYAALAADRVIFNTHYNRETFLQGAHQFLKRMPERVDRSIIKRIETASLVLPVPLSPLPTRTMDEAEPRQPNLIVWNHRWEYDKNPDDFFAACEQLKSAGLSFRLAVLGQSFRDQPSAFAQAKTNLDEHILHWGYQERTRYYEILQQAGIVVSTAWHEFQGLAVMEAVQSGCVPLVPDRLCYPELYDPPYRYGHSAEDLARVLARWLEAPDQRPSSVPTRDWQWSAWLDAYRTQVMM